MTFNTGIIKKYNRNKLENKRYAYIITTKGENIPINQFSNFLFEKINEFYDFTDITLKMGGDGATWIENIADNIGADFVADKYHAIKALGNIFINGVGKRKVSKNWDNYFKSINLLKNGKYYELMKLLIINNVDKDILNYFKRSKQGIINQSAEWNIGVSAESDIFHLVKSITAGARIFSDNHFKNKIKAKADLLNSK